MSERKYLSVKEVAEITGLTRQAIYKRMTKDIQPFVTELNGQKYLKYEVLNQLNCHVLSTKVDNGEPQGAAKKLIEQLEKENQRLLDEIADLRQQLAAEREENKQNAAELRSLSAQVGDSLRHLTMGQAADKTKQLTDTIIEQQQQAPISTPTPKRHWWQRRRKEPTEE